MYVYFLWICCVCVCERVFESVRAYSINFSNKPWSHIGYDVAGAGGGGRHGSQRDEGGGGNGVIEGVVKMIKWKLLILCLRKLLLCFQKRWLGRYDEQTRTGSPNGGHTRMEQFSWCVCVWGVHLTTTI